MEKCLVTKLNGTVNNSSILRLGEMRFKVGKVDVPTEGTQLVGLFVNTPSKVEIIGDGYFTNKTLTENKGKSITVDKTTNGVFVSSDNDVEIALLNKYAITSVASSYVGQPSSTVNSSNKAFNIDELKYSSDLTKIILSNSKMSGDIETLKNLTALTILSANNTQVIGDIETLKNLTALSNIELDNTKVSGDIEALKNLVELTKVRFQNTKVQGNISNLSNLTKCSEINLYNNGCYGDISSLSKLTKLTRFICYNMSGNLASLTALSELRILEIEKSTVTGDIATLPAKTVFFNASGNTSTFTWSSRSSSSCIISIYGRPKISNIDKMLQDQANCVIPENIGNKTITATGTRTSASDAAVATLQQNGYTVSITPA